MAKTNRPPAFMALTYSPVTRLYRSGAGRGSNHARLRSASELDRIHAALLVGHEQHAAVVLVDIVGQRRLHAVARLRDEIAALLRIGRIADVDDAQTGGEPGDVEQAVLVHLLAQLMRAEPRHV